MSVQNNGLLVIKTCPTKRAADRASPCGYGAALLAIVLVSKGVLPVRPAANANRWHASRITR
jgi:hypothetical protein